MPGDIIDHNPDRISDEMLLSWNRAIFHTAQADPFCCSPAWQLSFRRAFTEPSSTLIRGTEDSLICFEKLLLSDGSPCFAPLEYMWFSGCPVMGPEGAGIFSESLDIFRDLSGGAELRFIISGLESKRKLLTKISQSCGISFRGGRIAVNEQRSASLEGGVDGWLSRRSANCRATLAKAVRRSKENGFSFERPAITPESASELFERMLDLEKRSWKGMEGSGIVESRSSAFYREMLAFLSRTDEARLIFAVRDGRDAGFIFGGLAGSFYRGQQFSYDHEYARFSVGDILQFEQISDLCGEGIVRYDMGMSNDPRMAYKEHWAESVRHSEAWIIIPQF
ncbi:MAG: GNAT family N-acetyltransferase [Mailhella sp.]|nr:GNAT family N-acetyltransferase [Mailhella sp.]